VKDEKVKQRTQKMQVLQVLQVLVLNMGPRVKDGTGEEKGDHDTLQ
jgi:hypothetical protein